MSAVAEFTEVCHMPGLVVFTLKKMQEDGGIVFSLIRTDCIISLKLAGISFMFFPQTESYCVFLGGLEPIK